MVGTYECRRVIGTGDQSGEVSYGIRLYVSARGGGGGGNNGATVARLRHSVSSASSSDNALILNIIY